MIPDSFCTICTSQCKQELVGFLLSLSIHHPNSKVYVMCDSETKKNIDNLTPQPKLNIEWFEELNKYSNMNRSQMEKNGLWSNFQMAKAEVIEKALEIEKDTLFLDSDIIILDKLDNIDKTKQIGVSPQFIKEKNVREVGYYNGGVLWTNQKSLPNNWKKYTKTSRYFDQASIEDLVKIYSYFEFDENYNLQTWRFILGVEPTEKIISNLKIINNKIYYKNKPLKFIHTHFNQHDFKEINNIFIKLLLSAKYYKEILCIYRLIHNKWILKIPKQPLQGLFSHKNDSYRELAIILKTKNKDVDVIFHNNGHCMIEPNIITYDRPTLTWANQDLVKSPLVLLGNGSMNVEGKQLQSCDVNVKPWIFWPRRPMVLEKVLREKEKLNYDERNISSIFIGNFENSTQQKFRQTNHNWKSVLDEYHCTAGQTHKFTQQEYLMKLRDSKYGLCLRGYGSKCHREVELMAFGTVPIVTPEVSISSYMDEPKENVHYLLVKTPEELKEKVNSISKEKWEFMSQACYEWYQRNVHSDNCWNTMITNILYN